MSTRPTDTPSGRDDDLVVHAYRDATRADPIRAEPPRALDDAILAAARRAAGAQPESMHAYAEKIARSRRPSFFWVYQTPLAVAATLVVAIGVAIKVYDSGEATVNAPRPAVVAQASREAPPVQSQVQVQPDLQRTIPVPQRAPDIGAPMSADRVAGLERSRAAAPAPETALGAAKAGATSQESASLAKPPVDAMVPLNDSTRARVHAIRPPAAEAPSAPLAAAPAAPPPVASEAEARPAARAAAPLRQERRMEASGALPASIDTLIAYLAERPPEAWIEQIRALKARDSAQLARDLLAEYRRRFPTEPIPDDLR